MNIMLSNRLKKLIFRIEKGMELINNHRPLSNSILNRLQEQFIIEMTYNSNAIEGNTLTLKETKLVLENGITIGGKSLKEHLETINHRDAIKFIEKLAASKEKITERVIREIHSLILKEIDPDYAGRYRDVAVRIVGSSHKPPEHIKINELMATFEKEVLRKRSLHPIIKASLAHFELVSIHPFVDGNGRCARLLMNLILIKHGFLPAIVLNNDRRKYYNTLEKAHKKDKEEFIIFICRAIERTVYLYLEAIPKINEKMITLAQASKISPYSIDYLNVLARRGAIPAFKIKRNWVVSQKALDDYIKEHMNANGIEN
ncbi:MAG: Fic family protein [Pseudomonadota bacterium]